ncbi:MAG: potassium channel family protein [Desulfonauticus sp.]|nr:potassium channel family protein [Desulfonauticus sp.]
MKINSLKILSKTWCKLGLFFVFLISISALLFFYIEPNFKSLKDLFLAFWWTIVTVTTVGYGDVVPSTLAGKVLGIIIMLTGIGLVSILTGNLASFLMEQRLKQRKGQAAVYLKDHLVVLNWNKFGLELIKKAAFPVLIVASLQEETFEHLKSESERELHYINAPSITENILRKARVGFSKAIIILSPDTTTSNIDPDQEVLHTLLNIKQIAPGVPVFAEIIKVENRPHLIRAGADKVLIRGEAAALLLSQVGISPFVFTFMNKLLTNSNEILKQRSLSAEEKQLTWQEFKEKNKGIIPLALCKEKSSISLSQIMDDNTALDVFIQEMFTASGVEEQFNALEPDVRLNPEPTTILSQFDAVIYI